VISTHTHTHARVCMNKLLLVTHILVDYVSKG